MKHKAEETHERYPAYATPGQYLQPMRTEYPAQPLQSGAPQPWGASAPPQQADLNPPAPVPQPVGLPPVGLPPVGQPPPPAPPQALEPAALNNPFARSMMGAGVEGMGAGTAAAAPPPPEFAPQGMSEDEMLAEAIRRSMSEDSGGGGGSEGNQPPSQP